MVRTPDWQVVGLAECSSSFAGEHACAARDLEMEILDVLHDRDLVLQGAATQDVQIPCHYASRVIDYSFTTR